MCTHRDKNSVIFFGIQNLFQIVNLAVRLKIDTKINNALNFRIQCLSRQAVFRNPIAHHAARFFQDFHNRHFMPEQSQMIGSWQTRRSRPDHKNALSRCLGFFAEWPAFFQSHVAQELLNRVNPNRIINDHAVTRPLARMIANPPHCRRHRIILHNLTPCVLIAFLLD